MSPKGKKKSMRSSIPSLETKVDVGIAEKISLVMMMFAGIATTVAFAAALIRQAIIEPADPAIGH